MKSIILTSILLMLILAVSCGEETKNSSRIPSSINPNGDSELALLMRAMAEEAEQMKVQIANGDAVTVTVAHEEILTAEATEPEKAASAPYEAFATSYLQSIEELKTASPVDVAAHYDELISKCTTCHQALCPGPLVRIEKLER